MNEYGSISAEWRSSKRPARATRWAARFNQGLRGLSMANFMHFCLLSLLMIATAKAMLQGDGPRTQSVPASEQRVTLTLEEIVAEANARAAEGVPADDVAAWREQAIAAAGIAGNVPAPRNLYGQARRNHAAERRSRSN